MSGYNDRPNPSVPPTHPKEYLNMNMSLELLPKELKGHEVRYFGKIPVYITTLPAGTLLFRGVHHINAIYNDFLGYRYNIYDYMKKDELLEQFDTRGIPLPPTIEMDEEADPQPDWFVNRELREALAKSDRAEGKEPTPRGDRALRKTFNVFFYPFPMVDSSVGAGYPTVVVDVVPRDVKIATLISPSPYARGIRNSGSFVQTCRGLDPCFTEKFIERNPDVIGMIAIYAQDAASIKSSKYLNKYFTLYGDVRPQVNRGVPEIILYPRTSFTNTTTIESKDLAEIVKAIPDLTYIPYHIMEHRSEEKLSIILDTGLAGTSLKELLGFEDELFIDKMTGFYVSKKYYTGDMSRLIKDRSALSPGEGIFDFPKTLDGPGASALASEEGNEDYRYLQVPPGWVKKWTNTNQEWYVEEATGKAETNPPLPPGWKRATSRDGKPVFASPDKKAHLYFPYQIAGRRKTLRRRR